jgi:hypothetical protein
MSEAKQLVQPFEELDEELVDDPNEPDVVWDMKAVAQASEDYEAGLIELIPWEQVKA